MSISSAPKVSLGDFEALNLTTEQGKLYRIKAAVPFWYPASKSALYVIGVNAF